MNNWELALYGLAGLSMSVFSGIAGSGAGFVMTPLAILLGLTPAQAVSTGKFNGLAVTFGSLSGLRGHKERLHKGRIIAIMALALVVGLLVPFVIRALDSRLYRVLLGTILLLLIPVMAYKKVGIKPHTPSRVQQAAGGVLLTGSLFLQGAFSGGLGTLVNVVLMGMLGMTANEAHITKRWSQLILNSTIIIGVLADKFIVWKVVAVSVVTMSLGSYLGGHIAIRKGNAFAVRIMMALMLVSAVFLILGAL